MGESPAARTVLFVHNSDDLYGAEIILLQLIKGLDRKRFTPLVILPADVQHIGLLSKELQKAGIEYQFVRLGILRRKYLRPLRIVQYFFELLYGVIVLRRLIRERRVAIVHSNTITVLGGALAARLTGTPHVWHIHEIFQRPKIARSVLHKMVRRLSSFIVTPSNAVRDHIVALEPGAADRVVVIHNGIDLSPYEVPADPGKIRREFNIAQETPLVGMVGRVTHWKGQEVFAAAASEALKAHPNARFMAVGGVFDNETHYMEELKATLARLELGDHFTVVGFRRDVRDFLAAFDIFVSPSTSPDPFPTVVLEAMAASKPVIGTRHGGLVEMVAEGETGMLVRPSDSDDLAKAISYLLLHPRESRVMGQAGGVRLREQFKVERFVEKFESLYERAIAARSA